MNPGSWLRMCVGHWSWEKPLLHFAVLTKMKRVVFQHRPLVGAKKCPLSANPAYTHCIANETACQRVWKKVSFSKQNLLTCPWKCSIMTTKSITSGSSSVGRAPSLQVGYFAGSIPVYRSTIHGKLSEWPKETVLKTAGCKSPAGSNPALPAIAVDLRLSSTASAPLFYATTEGRSHRPLAQSVRAVAS